ncbi:MAG: TolB-like protein/DNA-binding winged helix-turn-helix (wHTH) protein [Arenicella sp.]|jgi:TolB-like protein/DNA-binding winged helix-turn-helix (wHTH) protein
MIFIFNSCELQTDNFTLQVNGVTTLVEPHVFDLILYLINHRNRVVTRGELFNSLWAGREVCDATLSNTIKCARAYLGDDGEQQTIIKTTRGRGYQFIAEIQATSGETKSPNIPVTSLNTISSIIPTSLNSAHYLKLLLLAFILCFFILSYKTLLPFSKKTEDKATTNHNLIAVLPFENLSGMRANKYFTDGVHEELLTQISHIKNIDIISRNSVMNYKNTNKSIRQIGQELGVVMVISGGVQRSSKQIRMHIQLIDTTTDANLWAETYTRSLSNENEFIIQSEIAHKIVNDLQVLLSAEEQR